MIVVVVVLASETVQSCPSRLLFVIKDKTLHFRKSLIARRVLANVFVLGVLSASAYLIYLVVKRSDEREKEGKPPTVLEQYEVRKKYRFEFQNITLPFPVVN